MRKGATHPVTFRIWNMQCDWFDLTWHPSAHPRGILELSPDVTPCDLALELHV